MVREKLLAHRTLVGGMASAAIVVSLAFIGTRLFSHNSAVPKFADRSYYTTDEGATLFADEIGKIPPFEHEGKSAVRAYVFTCDGGHHQWVQYLEKYSDEALKVAAAPPVPGAPGKSAPPTSGLMVKKPGDAQWIHETDPKARQTTDPKCPDGMGTATPEMVNP